MSVGVEVEDVVEEVVGVASSIYDQPIVHSEKEEEEENKKEREKREEEKRERK